MNCDAVDPRGRRRDLRDTPQARRESILCLCFRIRWCCRVGKFPIHQRDGAWHGLIARPNSVGGVRFRPFGVSSACDETEDRVRKAGGDDISIHITCEGEGEVLDEYRIIEIPAVGDGIDDGVGGGVGFEEAGTAIDADGFGGCVGGESDAAGAGCDSDAFDVGEFQDAVVGIVIVGEADAVAIEGIGTGRAVGHVLGGDVGGDVADLADAPVGLGDLVAVVGIVEGFADDEATGGVGEEVEIDGTAFFHQGGEGGDAVVHQLEGHPAGVAAVFEVVRGVAFRRPVEAQDFSLVSCLLQASPDAAVAFNQVVLGHVVAVHENHDVLTFLCGWRSNDFLDEGGAVDLVGGGGILFVGDLEEAGGSGFARERTAFDGTGADNIVGHR